MTTTTWLPFYTGDYLKNTMHLSTEEHGAYLLLICHYWQHGKIKNDAKLLKNITKISQKKLQNVLAFFDEKNGFFEHTSIEKIKLDAQANQDKMRARAEKAAAARWQKDDACSIPQAMLKQCPSPSPSPFIDKSINKKEKKKGLRLIPFLETFEIYLSKYSSNPNNFMPDEFMQWAESLKLNSERAWHEWDKFILYFTGDDCKMPVKKNWYQAWQKWLQKNYK